MLSKVFISSGPYRRRRWDRCVLCVCVCVTCEQVELLVQLQQLEGAPRPPALLLGQTVVDVPLVFGGAAHPGCSGGENKHTHKTITHLLPLFLLLFKDNVPQKMSDLINIYHFGQIATTSTLAIEN